MVSKPCFPSSVTYEKAQQMSEIISIFSFSQRTLARTVTAFLIWWNGGPGLPRHRFVSVHDEFLQKLLPAGVAKTIEEIGSIAPFAIIKFLMFTLSPARFPSPQMDYSMTSKFLLPSNLIRASIAPLSTKVYAYLCSPQAIFVMHQADSN